MERVAGVGYGPVERPGVHGEGYHQPVRALVTNPPWPDVAPWVRLPMVTEKPLTSRVPNWLPDWLTPTVGVLGSLAEGVKRRRLATCRR